MISTDYVNGFEDGRACQFTTLLIGLLSGCIATFAVLYVWGWLA